MKNCKYCGSELEDGQSVCPGCGREWAPEETAVPEETLPAGEAAAEEAAASQEPVREEIPAAEEKTVCVEKKKGITGASAVALAVAAVVLLAAILAVLVMNGKKQDAPAETLPAGETTQAQEETQPATIPADGNPDDVTCKGTYTVSDEQAIADRDQVVATSGSHQLTNGQLQVHYWLTVQNFYAQYGSYAPYLGLDHTQSMDTQVCGMAEGLTWQQYFLDQALNSWEVYEAVAQAAEEDGFRLPAEVEQELEELEAGLEQTASENGFDDALHMLQVNFGSAVTMQDYVDYWKLYYLSSRYYNEVAASYAPTDGEIAAFFNAHEAEYAQKGLTRDTVTVDVRHILITPEGETQEDGTYPEEAWTAAEKKAQELLDTFLKGDGKEDSFAALANEHSTDPGSNTNGGLYEGVSQGQMVESFDAWCFDSARKPGDTGIVKTNYGYHVMYFVGANTVWQEQAKSDMLSQKAADFVDQALAKAEAKIDYGAVKLALVDMS